MKLRIKNDMTLAKLLVDCIST